MNTSDRFIRVRGNLRGTTKKSDFQAIMGGGFYNGKPCVYKQISISLYSSLIKKIKNLLSGAINVIFTRRYDPVAFFFYSLVLKCRVLGASALS